MCFYIGYLLLLKIITNAIIKATATIVIVINEKNNMYIIFNNDWSIIRLTSLKGGKSHLLSFNFYVKYYTINLEKKQANIQKKYKKFVQVLLYF